MGTAPNRARSRALKVKFKALIVAIGGIEEAERLCRVGKTTLARYYSLHDEHADCFPPVDVVRDLEEVAGDPIVTKYMAQEAGGTFVPTPAAVATGGDLLTLVGAHARELGELVTSLGMGLSDGRLCGADARKALPEARDVVAVASKIIAELEMIVNEGDEA